MVARALMIVSVWLTILLPGVSFAAQEFEYNIDRPGNDIYSEAFPSSLAEGQCREMCRRNFDCQSWTYVKPGYQGEQGMCYLKSGLPGYVPNDCCISGVMERVTEFNIDRPGNDFESFVTTDVRECSSACRPDKNGCRAWTFDKNNSMCFLKNPIPDAWPNSCCTSGVGLPSWTSF